MISDEIQPFVGKICTIFTVPTNRDFNAENQNPGSFPAQMMLYFVGQVEKVTNFGVTILQVTPGSSGGRSWFSVANIVCIAEEQVLDEENDKEIIEKMKNSPVNQKIETKVPVNSPLKTSEFIDLKTLESLSKFQRPTSIK